MKPTLFYRIAAVVMILFAAGHTIGFRKVDPRWGADGVVSSMRTVQFAVNGMPRTYWDFSEAKKYVDRGQTPWTPAISMVYAFDVALDMLLKQGVPAIVAKHQRIGDAARRGVKSIGLSVFADEKHASNTVTAVSGPAGLDIKELRRILREEDDIVLGGGQQALDGKIFRIGHMGWVTEEEIGEVVRAVKAALPRCGMAAK